MKVIESKERERPLLPSKKRKEQQWMDWIRRSRQMDGWILDGLN